MSFCFFLDYVYRGRSEFPEYDMTSSHLSRSMVISKGLLSIRANNWPGHVGGPLRASNIISHQVREKVRGYERDNIEKKKKHT